MIVKVSKQNTINLDKYYMDSNINIYKNFDILHSELFHAIIIPNEDEIELFNLIIYNNKNHDEVISYLINNKFFNINFDLNFIQLYKHIISSLLSKSYNMPYIINDESYTYPLPFINLLYNPDIDIINIQYINYMLKEFEKQDTSICQAWGTFHQPTLNTIYNKILNDKGEISGKLNINQTLDESNKIVFEISNQEILFNGDSKEVDSVESTYNFHTHPKQAYFNVAGKTDLGWPSVDDYIIFIMAFIYDTTPTYFHWVCTVEGIYLLTIPPETIKVLKSIRQVQMKIFEEDIENYLYDNINIKKEGFRKK